MKTREDVLKQDYLQASDIQVIIPTLGIEKCRELIKEVQEDMESKNLYVPPSTSPRLALKKLVVKKLGI